MTCLVDLTFCIIYALYLLVLQRRKFKVGQVELLEQINSLSKISPDDEGDVKPPISTLFSFRVSGPIECIKNYVLKNSL